jgi:putative glutamine amidotransferase
MDTRTPLIGVTRCSRLDDYLASIEQSGGRTRILEVSESAQAVLGQIDAVLLTGGGDVDPAFYRQERHPTVHDAEPGRDEFEIDLARRAIDQNVPLLAICRGAQVLNVADGGTLIQDIPSEVTSAIRHRVETPKDSIAHTVRLTPGSLLERMLGSPSRSASSLPVNSRHHQSVATVSPRFSVVATALDDVVEAIEHAGARFCVGVQWHPENFWRTGEFKILFDRFTAAAAGRR